jgi:hypothetical protein
MHTYVTDTQLYNKMCLSSGVLITDVCIRSHLFDICGSMHGTCVGSSKARIQYIIVYIVRDTMTRCVLSTKSTQPLKVVTSLVGVADFIRKNDISLRMKHTGLHINFNTDLKEVILLRYLNIDFITIYFCQNN